MYHITENRYEWSHRRVSELQVEIAAAKQALKETSGFIKRFKAKRLIMNLIKQQNKHGNEMLEYERVNFSR